MYVLDSPTRQPIWLVKQHIRTPARAIHMTNQIQNNNDLLSFLVSQASSGQKNWFGYTQQRIVGINTAYELAVHHGDKFTPDEIVDYVVKLNNAIYQKIIKGTENG